MTIVTLGDKYYLPFMNGFQEITKEMAMKLYDENLITHTEDLSYEHD